MTSLVLPRAPIQYRQDDEQVFRDLARRGIEGSLGKSELPQYPGVPLMLVSGTNTAWNAPTGATPTKAPFDTVITNSSPHSFNVSGAVNSFKVVYGGTYRLYVHLFHNGGGAVKKVDIAACVFKNGTEVLRNTVQRELDQIWNTEGTFIATLAANDIVDVRVQHTETANVAFNLTFSRMMLEQMTPNPTYKDRTRA